MSSLPAKIDGTVPGTFCYITIKERWPKILTKIIDQIHKYQPEAVQAYGKGGDEDVKYILRNFSELKYRMITDKPLLDIEDKNFDAEIWNKHLANYRNLLGDGNVTWYKAPWLFVECYLYRKLHEMFITSQHMKKYDPFFVEKKQAFIDSKPHILAIGTRLIKDTENENYSKKDLRLDILRLLQVSLWGNKCDLSLSGGDPHFMSDTIFHELEELRPFILADDLEEACDKYLMGPSKLPRIDIILDNAGLELFTDICLADFLLSKNYVDKVVLHGKIIPWFVSDTTLNDLNWVIEQLCESDDEYLKKLGLKWTNFLSEGKLVFKSHRFWTYGYDFSEMKTISPDLYEDLQSSSFLIFKGDLNYRKLLGDRLWPHNIEFKTSLCGFEPTSFLALRTMKAELVSGLSDSAIQKIRKKFPKKEDKSWMTSSDYAVAQIFKL